MSEPPPQTPRPERQPNYALRQLVGLATLTAIALAAWGVVSAFGGGSPHDQSAGARGSLLDALAPELEQTSGGSVSGAHISLPLGRAVEQLFLVGFGGTDTHAPFFARLRERDWGGVVLDSTNFADTTQLRALTAALASTAAKAGHTTPFIAVRQAGGDQSALSGLPPTPQPDQAGNPATAQQQAIATAQALRSLRVDMNLAPDADLGYQGAAAQGRAFATDPTLVAQLTAAALAGYRRLGVIAVVGHFPGEGAASQDPESGPATVGLSLSDLQARDLKPFAAVAASAPAIQTSDALFTALDPVTPASLSAPALSLLRTRLHYGGVVVSGDLVAAAGDANVSVGDAAVAALRAGSDLLYVPGDPANQEQAYAAVLAAVRSGEVPAATTPSCASWRSPAT